MKSATLTRHLHSSAAPVCMFHMDYTIWEYCFPFQLVNLKVDISLSIDYFNVYKASIHWVSFSSSQRPRRQKVHPVCFHYFTKAQWFVVIVSAQINAESLQIWKLYYSFLYDQKWGSILSASERTNASICPAVSATVQLTHSTHSHLNSAHISKLTSDWAAM